jgi:hypothetical protein
MHRLESKMSDDVHVIKLGKTKVFLLLAGAVIFGGVGAWILSMDDADILEMRRNPAFIRGVAWAAVAFGAAGLVFALRKLFDPKPGLVLSSRGIEDHSSAVAAGFIPWGDITGFSVFQVHRTKMVIILVREPEKYIERGGAMKRALNRANMKMTGSPLSISAATLEIKFDELHQLLENYRAKYAPAA